eukprot:4050337-Alexandrium_andersonii.AAC.1
MSSHQSPLQNITKRSRTRSATGRAVSGSVSFRSSPKSSRSKESKRRQPWRLSAGPGAARMKLLI